MSAAERRAIHRRWLEALLRDRNDRALEQWFSPGHVLHQTLGEVAPGPRGLRRALQRLGGIFNEWMVEVVDQCASGDRVMTRFKAHGRHGGAIGPMRATGRWLSFQALLSSRFIDEVAYESWLEVDVLDALMAIDAVAVRASVATPKEP